MVELMIKTTLKCDFITMSSLNVGFGLWIDHLTIIFHVRFIATNVQSEMIPLTNIPLLGFNSEDVTYLRMATEAGYKMSLNFFTISYV